MTNRDSEVYMAKLAEQAERYDGTCGLSFAFLSHSVVTARQKKKKKKKKKNLFFFFFFFACVCA
jgi:hypothetical protein